MQVIQYLLPTRLAKDESRSSDTNLLGGTLATGRLWFWEATVGFRRPPNSSKPLNDKQKKQFESLTSHERSVK